MNKSSLLVLLFCFSATFAQVPVAMNCPDGWKWWIRSRGGWCMKVFAETITEIQAEEKCAEHGAVIAGVQNSNESEWMAAEFESLHKGTGYFWIGSKRITPCRYVGITNRCTQITSFYWIDKSTVGVQGFRWMLSEPNNVNGTQGCVGMESTSLLMDDLRCSDKTSGYVCGKVASFD
ncbi:hypothetical protein B9Z55_007254 [Caenorhabditis nigoni]|uniref:C-type lectin domain-containing protein n=1 Tax=Caenorhabditis nigoni TaxID=1611254 RepID=A0A2G5V8R9_9PELO|nr:hypothetical protein B9Z55_007254 [Caenorhabditis nigoni]